MSPLLLNRIESEFDFVSVNYKSAIEKILNYYFNKGIRNFIFTGIITSDIYPVTCLKIARDFLENKKEKTKIFAECFLKRKSETVAQREKQLLKEALVENGPIAALAFQYSSLQTMLQVQQEMNIPVNDLEIAVFDEFIENIPLRRYIHEIIEPVDEIG